MSVARQSNASLSTPCRHQILMSRSTTRRPPTATTQLLLNGNVSPERFREHRGDIEDESELVVGRGVGVASISLNAVIVSSNRFVTLLLITSSFLHYWDTNGYKTISFTIATSSIDVRIRTLAFTVWLTNAQDIPSLVFSFYRYCGAFDMYTSTNL